jgi:hypothetical protein
MLRGTSTAGGGDVRMNGSFVPMRMGTEGEFGGVGVIAER